MRRAWLALILICGVFAAPLVQARTLDELVESAEAGNIDAQVELGYRYLKGLGVPEDRFEARRWLELPANRANLPYAKRMLGQAYWGEDRSDADNRRAFELFGDAYELGDEEAGLYYGWMRATGMGVTEDRYAGRAAIERAWEAGVDGAEERYRALEDIPTTVSQYGCDIYFVNGKEFDAWLWVEDQVTSDVRFSLAGFACQASDGLRIEVDEYLGRGEQDGKYYFDIYLDSCDMELAFEATATQITYNIEYDVSCHRHPDYGRAAAAAVSPSGGGYASRTDFYNACLGMTDYDTNCFNVNDPDLKNLCLANSGQGYETNCYSIADPDIKNLCLASAYPDYDSFCYSIGNEDIKNTCLARSNVDYRNFCYNIDIEPWRSFCGGIALNSSNCFNLN